MSVLKTLDKTLQLFLASGNHPPVEIVLEADVYAAFWMEVTKMGYGLDIKKSWPVYRGVIIKSSGA